MTRETNFKVAVNVADLNSLIKKTARTLKYCMFVHAMYVYVNLCILHRGIKGNKIDLKLELIRDRSQTLVRGPDANAKGGGPLKVLTRGTLKKTTTKYPAKISLMHLTTPP